MPDLAHAERVHLIGIGGAGMAALASLLLGMGKAVSGSELVPGGATEQLVAAGATVFAGHAAANVGEAQYVVRSSAVPADNVEVVEAEQRDIPVSKLADAVGELMREHVGVAIAGTHGKTTTTALTAFLLESGGLDPIALIGADTPTFPGGARLGEGPMVVEADEYDRRFLSYWPEVAVVTGIEADHLDYYRDLAEIRGVFQELVARLPAHGLLVACADDACAVGLATPAQRETYGFSPEADWRIDAYESTRTGAAFDLNAGGRTWRVMSPLVGEHNARNVVAAIAVADYFGVGLQSVLAALPAFKGPKRRFETRGRPRGVWIVDDYGHHPTEVAAVLKAAQTVAEGEVWVVFQPHTTNRTYALLDEFGAAFGDADHALLLPIFKPSGREVDARDVRSEDVVERVRERGHADARALRGFDEAVEVVRAAKAGDLVITMGAGDVTRLADVLVQALG